MFNAKAADIIDDVSALMDYDKWLNGKKGSNSQNLQFDKRQSMLNFKVDADQIREHKKLSLNNLSPEH